MTEIVGEEQRGSAMSLTMALGQIGTGVGAAVAGPAYGAAGYVTNTAMGAAAAVLVAGLVWLFLPGSHPSGAPGHPG